MSYSVSGPLASHWWAIKTEPKDSWKVIFNYWVGFNELLEWKCNLIAFLIKPPSTYIAVREIKLL